MSLAHDNFVNALAKMGNTMGLAPTIAPLDNEEPPEVSANNGPEVVPGQSLQDNDQPAQVEPVVEVPIEEPATVLVPEQPIKE